MTDARRGEPGTPGGSRARWLGPLALLLLLALASLLPDLGGEPLWHNDDVRRTAVAREMRTSGDWVTPRLFGEPLAYYPPLGYWAIVGLGLGWGIDPTVARLPSALAALGVLLVVFWLGLLTLDARRALAAVAVLVTSNGFIGMGRVVAPDMLLVLFQLLQLALFLEWLRERSSGSPSRVWILSALVVSAALGILAKGPVAVGFPGVVALLFLAVSRRLGELRGFPWLRCALGVAVLALPWYVLVGWLEGVDFLYQNLIVENVLAPAGLDKHVNGPAFYLLPLIGRMFPWSLLLLAVALGDRSWRRPETRFAWVWFLALLVVLSASAGKRVTYLLFLYPPAALLLGDAAIRLWDGRTSRLGRSLFRIAAGCVVLAGLTVAAGLALRPDLLPPDHARVAAESIRSMALGALVLGLALLGATRARPRRLLPAVVVVTALAIVGYGWQLRRLQDTDALRGIEFCREIAASVPPDEPVVTLGPVRDALRLNTPRRLRAGLDDLGGARPHYLLVTDPRVVPPGLLNGARLLAEAEMGHGVSASLWRLPQPSWPLARASQVGDTRAPRASLPARN